ncbi:hypothetical protein CSUI_005099 [Cystoisospora suis]|uniref:Transmembrane protein n=1 Tax=Cystoisospora suis TaxID=483139 RepID=A0A2C6KZ55_9APIC|nr:hypothetical protein CSUI_005099 [Cystoisospora suis]
MSVSFLTYIGSLFRRKRGISYLLRVSLSSTAATAVDLFSSLPLVAFSSIFGPPFFRL